MNDTVDESRTDKRVTVWMLATDRRLLTILSINIVVITGNFTVLPALPAIGEALAVPDGRLGLVMIAFTLPTAVMIPIVGIVADLYGRRRVVLPALVLFGVAGLTTPLVGSFGALLVLRMIQGIAFAGTVPLTVTLVGDFFQGSTGATAQGLRSSSSGAGNLLAPAVAGILVGIAWFYPFYLYGLALGVFLLVAVTLLEPITGARADAEYPSGIADELREYVVSFQAEVTD